MARRSLKLLLIMVLGGPSCLVTQSPEFEQPKRTRPYITRLLSPPAYQIISISSKGLLRTFDQMDLQFELLSEDLQNGPVAVLGLDFKGPAAPASATVVGYNNAIPAGHLMGPDSGPRVVDILLQLPTGTTAGCHSITLMVTHQTAPGFAPTDESDVDYATWWALVDVNSTDLTDCVVPETGDGGLDSTGAGP